MPAFPLTGLLRLAKRPLRWLKRKLLSYQAIRDLRQELLEGDFKPADLYGHEVMLADAVRMDAYRAAIVRNVKPGDVVVDLGTGTGILSMLAARQNPKAVHAIDYSNIIGLAERIAGANHFRNITFHHVNSRRFVLDEPVDVILHEQIGQALLDEGMVDKILDLKRRLLKKSGRILPGRFELFLEPMRLKDDARIPHLWKNSYAGIDFSPAKEALENGGFEFSGHDWQVGSRSAIDCFICEPSPILAFDLNEISDAAEIPKTVSASRLVRRPGTMDGFCLYFRVVFDAESGFDTSPFSAPTHWTNLHFRLEAGEFQQGDAVAYTLEMPDPLVFESWIVRMVKPA